MNNDTLLRGGIVGCGYFAKHHIEAWKRIENVEIRAACDRDIEKARSFSPRVYASAEDMLARERLDFIDIAAPPGTHAELIEIAARRGIAAICQKPMAVNDADARRILEICLNSGARIMIHENWRWQPWYRRVRDAIGDGAIGTPITYWMRTVRADGMGPQPYPMQPYFVRMPRLLIYETLVHHIDTARFLFGGIESIYALARRRNGVIAGEDQALLALRHVNDVDGCISGHRFLDASPEGPVMGEAVIEGEAGVLAIHANGDVIKDGGLWWKNEAAEGYRGDSVRATQQHFVDCLRTGARFETDVFEYYETFRAAEAAYTSISSRCATAL